MARERTVSYRDLPECGYVFDDVSCTGRGDHFCVPRADRAQAFIEEVCVHTKSVYARKRFVLEDWQRDGIVRPLFGTVRWAPEWAGGMYVRRYTVAWVELGRGNGKSELAAAIVLLLLVGDDEQSAEVYGAAKDTKQAGKVGEVVKRMFELSPTLSRRLRYNKQARRLIDPESNSYYEVIPGDAEGELGHNAYGAVIDEVLAQAGPELWDALRTSHGKRPWSLLLGFTTAGNDPSGFAADQHQEMVRIAEDPSRAPHVLVYIRNTPADADPWDEDNWYHVNPGLGRFLSIQTLREEALEARNDPAKENAFRQFRLNQWVQQSSRWMPLHLYDACVGEIAADPDWVWAGLRGRTVWVGFDLAARLDLCAWTLFVPPLGDDPGALLWRFWLPEAAVPHLDKHNNNRVSRWAADGWITLTEGDQLNYERVYADVDRDAADFAIAGGDCDVWSMAPAIDEIRRRTRLSTSTLVERRQTYTDMTPGMTELMALVKSGRVRHFGNPVARWCTDAVEVRSPADNPDLIRPVKPDRAKSGKRIDGVVSAAMAVGAWSVRGQAAQPDRRMFVMR